MSNIARKTRLVEHLDSMKKKFRREYSFYPVSFALPRDRHHVKGYFEPAGKSKCTFIVKPDGGCQGKGIFLTKKWEDIEALSTSYVVQRYISNPLLIDNKKFDLRIYVLITSCDPLRIYLFQDGLVRLCTQDFVKPSVDNLDNTCMHLSNYSINKRSDDFNGPDDISGSSGSKRSVKWLLSWLAKERGGDEADKLWCKIGDICVKTILCIEPILVRDYNTIFCANSQFFDSDGDNLHQARTDPNQSDTKSMDDVNIELGSDGCDNKRNGTKNEKAKVKYNLPGSRSITILGFDIMIDSNLKPHLIEVNQLPSFGTDSLLDESIKSRVVLQALSVVQAAPSDQKVYEGRAKQIKEQRLFHGVGRSFKETKSQIKEANEMVNKGSSQLETIPEYINKNRSNKITSKIEEFVKEIYSIHAPEKMDKINILLQKYEGHEEWLAKKLKEKYCQPVKGGDTHVSSSVRDEENEVTFSNISCDASTEKEKERMQDEDERSEEYGRGESSEDEGGRNPPCIPESLLDPDMIREDGILVANGDYERIFPPKIGKYKAPPYQKMRDHAKEVDFKRQMRLICPLWQLRQYDRKGEGQPMNTVDTDEVLAKQEPQKDLKGNSYYSRGDWLVHGNVHKKSEPIPTRMIRLPSQKQIEAAERLSRGYSVENSNTIGEEESCLLLDDGDDFVTRLSLAEQAGKELRKKNEEKFIPKSQLNMNPINIAFEKNSSPSTVVVPGTRCYVDFTGRKLGYR